MPTLKKKRINYYPFGLRHNGYNDVQAGTKGGDFKYQGQERNDDLGLNWDSFKWRNYDYAIGRFMSIDPLAEKYPYNSTYAFQENKLGLGIELEGLELVNTRENPLFQSPTGQRIAGVIDFVGNNFSGAAIAYNFVDSAYTTGNNLGQRIQSGEVSTEDYVNAAILASPASGLSSMVGVSSLVDAAYSGDEYAQGQLLALIGTVFLSEVVVSSTPSVSLKAGGAATVESEAAVVGDGIIYEVPGEATSSGKPYIGRTKQGSPAIRGRGATDGRDRTKAKTIDRYNSDDLDEGRYREQRAIDGRGGVDNLDNRRNEMTKTNYNKVKGKYEDN